ncbi:hypothetical protein BJ742DRAFT_882276 [Cladochytrium replicatum]|nr:hypothetical protein BJ742DRAFT_882276 [Cladochytrium replicatum]
MIAAEVPSAQAKSEDAMLENTSKTPKDMQTQKLLLQQQRESQSSNEEASAIASDSVPSAQSPRAQTPTPSNQPPPAKDNQTHSGPAVTGSTTTTAAKFASQNLNKAFKSPMSSWTGNPLLHSASGPNSSQASGIAAAHGSPGHSVPALKGSRSNSGIAVLGTARPRLQSSLVTPKPVNLPSLKRESAAALPTDASTTPTPTTPATSTTTGQPSGIKLSSAASSGGGPWGTPAAAHSSEDNVKFGSAGGKLAATGTSPWSKIRPPESSDSSSAEKSSGSTSATGNVWASKSSNSDEPAASIHTSTPTTTTTIPDPTPTHAVMVPQPIHDTWVDDDEEMDFSKMPVFEDSSPLTVTTSDSSQAEKPRGTPSATDPCPSHPPEKTAADRNHGDSYGGGSRWVSGRQLEESGGFRPSRRGTSPRRADDRDGHGYGNTRGSSPGYRPDRRASPMGYDHRRTASPRGAYNDRRAPSPKGSPAGRRPPSPGVYEPRGSSAAGYGRRAYSPSGGNNHGYDRDKSGYVGYDRDRRNSPGPAGYGRRNLSPHGRTEHERWPSPSGFARRQASPAGYNTDRRGHAYGQREGSPNGYERREGWSGGGGGGGYGGGYGGAGRGRGRDRYNWDPSQEERGRKTVGSGVTWRREDTINSAGSHVSLADEDALKARKRSLVEVELSDVAKAHSEGKVISILHRKEDDAARKADDRPIVRVEDSDGDAEPDHDKVLPAQNSLNPSETTQRMPSLPPPAMRQQRGTSPHQQPSSIKDFDAVMTNIKHLIDSSHSAPSAPGSPAAPQPTSTTAALPPVPPKVIERQIGKSGSAPLRVSIMLNSREEGGSGATVKKVASIRDLPKGKGELDTNWRNREKKDGSFASGADSQRRPSGESVKSTDASRDMTPTPESVETTTATTRDEKVSSGKVTPALSERPVSDSPNPAIESSPANLIQRRKRNSVVDIQTRRGSSNAVTPSPRDAPSTGVLETPSSLKFGDEYKVLIPSSVDASRKLNFFASDAAGDSVDDPSLPESPSRATGGSSTTRATQDVISQQEITMSGSAALNEGSSPAPLKISPLSSSGARDNLWGGLGAHGPIGSKLLVDVDDAQGRALLLSGSAADIGANAWSFNQNPNTTPTTMAATSEPMSATPSSADVTTLALMDDIDRQLESDPLTTKKTSAGLNSSGAHVATQAPVALLPAGMPHIAPQPIVVPPGVAFAHPGAVPANVPTPQQQQAAAAAAVAVAAQQNAQLRGMPHQAIPMYYPQFWQPGKEMMAGPFPGAPGAIMVPMPPGAYGSPTAAWMPGTMGFRPPMMPQQQAMMLQPVPPQQQQQARLNNPAQQQQQGQPFQYMYPSQIQAVTMHMAPGQSPSIPYGPAVAGSPSAPYARPIPQGNMGIGHSGGGGVRPGVVITQPMMMQAMPAMVQMPPPPPPPPNAVQGMVRHKGPQGQMYPVNQAYGRPSPAPIDNSSQTRPTAPSPTPGYAYNNQRPPHPHRQMHPPASPLQRPPSRMHMQLPNNTNNPGTVSPSPSSHFSPSSPVHHQGPPLSARSSASSLRPPTSANASNPSPVPTVNPTVSPDTGANASNPSPVPTVESDDTKGGDEEVVEVEGEKAGEFGQKIAGGNGAAARGGGGYKGGGSGFNAGGYRRNVQPMMRGRGFGYAPPMIRQNRGPAVIMNPNMVTRPRTFPPRNGISMNGGRGRGMMGRGAGPVGRSGYYSGPSAPYRGGQQQGPSPPAANNTNEPRAEEEGEATGGTTPSPTGMTTASTDSNGSYKPNVVYTKKAEGSDPEHLQSGDVVEGEEKRKEKGGEPSGVHNEERGQKVYRGMGVGRYGGRGPFRGRGGGHYHRGGMGVKFGIAGSGAGMYGQQQRAMDGAGIGSGPVTPAAPAPEIATAAVPAVTPQ